MRRTGTVVSVVDFQSFFGHGRVFPSLVGSVGRCFLFCCVVTLRTQKRSHVFPSSFSVKDVPIPLNHVHCLLGINARRGRRISCLSVCHVYEWNKTLGEQH